MRSEVEIDHAGPIPPEGWGGLALRHRRLRFFELLKRCADIVLGLGGLVLMGLLAPVVAVSLAVESPGPLLNRQRRVGHGGKEFTLLKFRTMVPDAEGDGDPVWAQLDDGRVTRFGRLMRRLHLDEVPQALNLIRGEMSFIGPRPERSEFVAGFRKTIPQYDARHSVRPGITGWAQVNLGYGASAEDAVRKLEYDLFYIKHRSIWLDLVILARTIPLVLILRGR